MALGRSKRISKTDFGELRAQETTPKRRPLKIKEFHKTSSKFCDFDVFSSSRLRDPILDPPGLRFGSLLAAKMAENCLGIRLGAAKSRSRALLFGSGGLRELSKTSPRAL